MNHAPDASDEFGRLMVPVYTPADVMPVRGQGSYVWDADGKQYIDLAGGVAVTALGHAHTDLQEVLITQSAKLWHVGNVFTNEPVLGLAKRLIGATFAEKVFFANSGAEANEAALKLARKVAYDETGGALSTKNRIIAFQQSFHGRTLFTVSVGGQPKYREGFGPVPQRITHLPYNDINAAKAAIDADTCAVIVEPVQGEGGVIPASPEFLKALREQCDRVNALLIFDEVQTGVGRTGSLYAYMRTGVTPDILTTAKSLGNGFPIGAMLTTDHFARHFSAGVHGSTYGGNPLAAAVASKVLDIVNTDAVLNGVQERSAFCFDRLRRINVRVDAFKEIRGAGLLIGCELRDQFAGRSRELVKEGYESGVFTLMAGPNTLRLAPSLIIEPEVLSQALDRLELAIERFVS